MNPKLICAGLLGETAGTVSINNTMKINRLLAALIVATGLGFAADIAKIEPSAAAALIADGKAVLVDVREPAEWAETGVVAVATLLAKSDFDGLQTDWKPFLEKNKEQQIILYCRSGNRSGMVAKALAEKGFKVANAGGFKAWAAAGQPVRKIIPQP